MTYIITRFCQRLSSPEAYRIITEPTGNLDKAIKGISGIGRPIFELMTYSSVPAIALFGRAVLATQFFVFLETVGKNLMAVEIAKAPSWFINEFRRGLTWEKFFSTISNPFTQLGNVMDTAMFVESMFGVDYTKAAQVIGQIPVVGPILNQWGLKGVKAYTVIVAACLGTINVGVFCAYRAFVRDRNNPAPRAQIEAENEQQFANFFNSTSKGLVVWMGHKISQKEFFRFMGVCLFVCGFVLFMTNLWKYVISAQNAAAKAGEPAMILGNRGGNEPVRAGSLVFVHPVSQNREDLRNHKYN